MVKPQVRGVLELRLLQASILQEPLEEMDQVLIQDSQVGLASLHSALPEHIMHAI
jgi:hypothetical protein